jgi:hypothetical protein
VPLASLRLPPPARRPPLFLAGSRDGGNGSSGGGRARGSALASSPSTRGATYVAEEPGTPRGPLFPSGGGGGTSLRRGSGGSSLAPVSIQAVAGQSFPMAMAAARAPRHGGRASVHGSRARRPRLYVGSCSPRTDPSSSILSISADPRPSSAAPPQSARRRLLVLLNGEGEVRWAPWLAWRPIE